MKVEFIDNKDKVIPKFKVGDILALKVECDGSRTDGTRYYLPVFYNDLYFYLSNIETGILFENSKKAYRGPTEFTKEELADLIENYDGVLYSGDKVKLVIEK